MADALYDTTVFIDYYRGDENARTLVGQVLDGGATASYFPLTTFEIWMGISMHEEEIDYLGILGAFEEVPLDASMARLAATWLRTLSIRQSETLFRDALIAATATVRNEAIYTRNVRDFTRFHENVQSY